MIDWSTIQQYKDKETRKNQECDPQLGPAQHIKNKFNNKNYVCYFDLDFAAGVVSSSQAQLIQ